MQRMAITFLAFVVTFGALVFLAREVQQMPRFEVLKANYTSQDRAVVDRNGQLLDEVHPGNGKHRFNWIEFDQLPKFMRRAFLESTDLDLAHELNAWTAKSGHPNLLQMKLMELTWKKTELAEAYLNLALFRSELQGISAASYGLFDKAPQELSRAEAAVVLALHSQSEKGGITETACDWLQRMDAPEECGLLSQDHLMQIEKSYRIGPFVSLAPQFTAEFATVKDIVRGNVVRSSLDRELQTSVIQTLLGHGLFSAAVVVLDNASGNILAYVDHAPNEADRVVHAAQQILQPLIYAQALEERVLTTASKLERIPVRQALASAQSLPALSALHLIGEENFAQTLTALGLSGFEHANSFGPSLALGSVDVRLLELTNAYRALANGGTWSEFRVSPDKLSELAPRQVFSPETSFVIGDILNDHNGRSVFNTENWAIGFSEKYTVGVWVSRESAALGVWQEVMNRLHREDPAQPPIPPEGLVRAAVDLGRGRWLGEWFLAGTEPLAGEASALLSRISYPKNHDTIELDSLHKGLLIKVIAPKANQTLFINGERIGRAQTYVTWTARSGKHTLELRDSQGQVVDRVRFVVKGASFAQAR